jgi:hypothetical protein
MGRRFDVEDFEAGSSEERMSSPRWGVPWEDFLYGGRGPDAS